MNNPKIRSTKAADLPFLVDVVNTSGLFPGEMLPEMIGDSLDNMDSPDDLGNANSNPHWLTYETDRPIAVAYFAPEQMTSGTWNLYLIAVHSDYQGRGIGTQLIRHVEELLQSRGERILIVETSDLEAFALTRKFYEGLHYERVAHINEFYDKGEGKVTFLKNLN